MLRIKYDAFAWHEAEGNIIALQVATSRYLTMSGSALVLWSALAEGSTPELLSSMLVERYGISAEVARRDVDDFIDDLESRNGLEVVDPAKDASVGSDT